MALMTAGMLCGSLGLTGCKQETIAKGIPGVVEVENRISLKQ